MGFHVTLVTDAFDEVGKSLTELWSIWLKKGGWVWRRRF